MQSSYVFSHSIDNLLSQGWKGAGLGALAGLGLMFSLTGCDLQDESNGDLEGQQELAMQVTGSVIDTTPGALLSDSSLAGNPELGLRVLALNRDTDGIILAEAPGGNFDLELPSGHYALAVLDGNNSPMGLLIDDHSSFEVSANGQGSMDLGELELDRSTQIVTSSTSPASAADLPDLIDLISVVMEESEDGANGVDLGSLSVVGDADGDAVPNFLDNDSNANGLYDSVEGFHPCVLTYSMGDSYSGIGDLQESDCVVFDNLKLDNTQLFAGDGDLRPHTDQHIVTYQLTVPSTLVPNVVDVRVPFHPLFANGQIATYAGGFTFTGATPAVGSAWSMDSHRLHHAIAPDGSDVYTLWVDTTTDPVPSIFQIEVELVTGTVATFTTRLAYVFNTPPRVHSITDGVTATTPSYPTTAGDPGTMFNPIVIDSLATSVVLTADRPLVLAGGAEVCGMDFQAHIFFLDAGGSQINTVAEFSPLVNDANPCLPGFDLDLVLDTATWFPTTWSGRTVHGYKIDFTSVAHNGDNSAEFFWFTR